MNALKNIPTDAIRVSLPEDATINDWLGLGRDLFAQRRQVDWLLADWVATGMDRFGDQLQLALVGGEMGVEPKYLTAAAKTAQIFPPAQRDAALTLEHHEAVASLPTEDRLSLLKRAHAEGWTAQHTRQEAAKRKIETGQRQILSENDFEHASLVAIARAWNRASESVRAEFLEMATEADGGMIDA